ncbi:Os08g0140700, partial [Oryza sativa Japonica Group]
LISILIQLGACSKDPPMHFTHKPALGYYSASALDTLQIFSVKVAATSGGLQWPLDVFGIVSIRDSVDRNRNVVFHRTRDNCQTLTEQERNLVLVGPTRAVVLSMPDPLIIDVEMKVKGTTESEDKRLSLLAVPLLCAGKYYSHVLKSGSYTSKLSTLEFRLGYIVSSVEATISVRVIRGSWPDGFHGQFAAYTTGVRFRHLASEDILAGIELEKIVLLDSRGDQNVVTVSGDGTIELSRRVVSVEKVGKLKVLVRAWELVDHNNVVEQVKVFTPLEAGLSNGELDIGFCLLEVSVAWSLISENPVLAKSVL